MFDTVELGRLTGRQLLERAASNHRATIEAENQTVMIAAAWADDQDRDPSDQYAPLIHRASEAGSVGTPAVSEFAAAELGAVLGVGIGAGRALIADALDLRHRLPLAWSRLCAGHIRAWQARKLAQATRWLEVEQAGEVDAAVSGFLGAMPWPRFERILGAAVLQADPEAVAERTERARTERMVRSFDSDDGLRTVVARATSGDVAWFMATVNRIAEILELDGSSDSVDVRRSRAIGILAHPARALKLLIDHRNDRDRSPEPLEPPETSRPPESADPLAALNRARAAMAADRLEPASSLAALEATGPMRLFEAPGTVPTTCEAADDPTPNSMDYEFGGPSADAVDTDDLADDPGPDAGDDFSGLVPGPEAATELAAAIEGLDPRALRPRTVLYFHLAEAALGEAGALVRPEHGTALSLDQLHEFLSDTGCYLTVRPVITPADQAPVDGYEIPYRVREAVRLRNLVDVFPYASCASAEMDLDHTIAYRPDGPPGQTGLHNLGPLSRTSHRHATPGSRAGGHWRKRQPDAGTFLWRSPHGWTYLVTADGTLNLGTAAFARAVWQAADPQSDRAAHDGPAHGSPAHGSAAGARRLPVARRGSDGVRRGCRPREYRVGAKGLRATATMRC